VVTRFHLHVSYAPQRAEVISIGHAIGTMNMTMTRPGCGGTREAHKHTLHDSALSHATHPWPFNFITPHTQRDHGAPHVPTPAACMRNSIPGTAAEAVRAQTTGEDSVTCSVSCSVARAKSAGPGPAPRLPRSHTTDARSNGHLARSAHSPHAEQPSRRRPSALALPRRRACTAPVCAPAPVSSILCVERRPR